MLRFSFEMGEIMEQRLSILLMGNVINQSVHDAMLKVIDALENQFAVNIRSDQGNMALTHMASAMMRSLQKQEIEPIDAEILAEIETAGIYPKVQEIHQALLSFFDFKVMPSEEGYLLANLYSLMSVTD